MSPHRRTTIFTLLMVSLISLVSKAGFGQEVVVEVSGPWAYVADPSPTPSSTPRLALVAPVTFHHGAAAIFSGPNADDFPLKPTVQTGKYYLDIPNISCTRTPMPPSGITFPIKALAGNIKNAVDGPANRFAFSLPLPCSYESYIPSNSRLSPNTITGNETPGAYTVWMKLHYKVSNVSSATLTGNSDDKSIMLGSGITIQFTKLGSDPPAISIVLGSTEPLDSSSRCDSTSVRSVKDEAMVFNKMLHAQFPEVRRGGQTTTYYADCIDATQLLEKNDLGLLLTDVEAVESYLKSLAPEKLTSASQGLTRITTRLERLSRPLPSEVKQELAAAQEKLNPPLNPNQQSIPAQRDEAQKLLKLDQVRYYGTSASPGAGDCRGAQLSVTPM
jgi:hypothetical protein